MKFSKKLLKPTLIFCILIVAFFSIFDSGTKSLWLDEAYSGFIAQKNSSDMFHILWTQDGNAWLYYVLLHFWITFGVSEIAMRSLSGVFAIFIIPSVYLLTSKLFDSKIAKITIVLLSTNAFFIAYAQEVRGYTLLILLTTLSTYFFVKSMERTSNKNLIFPDNFFHCPKIGVPLP